MDEYLRFWKKYMGSYTIPDEMEYPGPEEFGRRLAEKFAEKPYTLRLYTSTEELEGKERQV